MDSDKGKDVKGKEGSSRVGVIVESLPNATFRVQLDDDKLVLVYLSGKMRLHRIKVLIGDKVEVFLDAYSERGRITKRKASRFENR